MILLQSIITSYILIRNFIIHNVWLNRKLKLVGIHNGSSYFYMIGVRYLKIRFIALSVDYSTSLDTNDNEVLWKVLRALIMKIGWRVCASVLCVSSKYYFIITGWWMDECTLLVVKSALVGGPGLIALAQLAK